MSQCLGSGGIHQGVEPVGRVSPAGVSRNLNFLLLDIAAEELTKSCANSFKLCSINCTQRVSHDVRSSLSRLAESGADPLQKRGMRVLPPRSWPKPFAALAQKLSGHMLSLQSCASRPFSVLKPTAGKGGGKSVSLAALPFSVLPESCLNPACSWQGGVGEVPQDSWSAQACSTGHCSSSVHPRGFPQQDLRLGRSGESSPVSAPAAAREGAPARQVSL